LVEAAAVVGVPVIAPVDVLSASPDGRAGEMEKVIGAVPPVEVTGVKEVAAVVAVRVAVAITRVVVRAGDIANENVLVAVAEEESVTVTV
jgi:hypothetical protein